MRRHQRSQALGKLRERQRMVSGCWRSLESSSPCHGENHGFKSRTARQRFCARMPTVDSFLDKEEAVGSTPTGRTKHDAGSSGP